MKQNKDNAMMAPMKPLLVGEINPLSRDERHALHPLPETSTGGNLCRLLGLTPRQYLRAFDRINLCRDKWDAANARIIAGTCVRNGAV